MMTQEQRRTIYSLEVEVTNHVKALGPAHAPAALRDAIFAAPMTTLGLRYLSRELDRLADRREREGNET